MIYRLLFALVLRRIDAERAHRIASRLLRAITWLAPVRAVLRRAAVPRDPALAVHALGRRFPTPLGVAAGLDKDATLFKGLGLLGFGFVEVGTLTASPQPGNPRPRMLRIADQRALLNRMGFPNLGAEAAAERLRTRTGDVIVGANVGKSMSASRDQIAEDYCRAVGEIAPWCDFITVNVSSPNTPGLREMQAVEALDPLIVAIQHKLGSMQLELPLLIKIGPDRSDEEIDALAQLALKRSLAGVIAVNTTTDRAVLADPSEVPASFEGGGVSGEPLKTRSLEVLRRLRANVGDSLVLISVGGVCDAEDILERIGAGATLVQAYTAFVYNGPAWPRRVNRELARAVRAAGAGSIQELVGSAAETGVRSPSSATFGP